MAPRFECAARRFARARDERSDEWRALKWLLLLLEVHFCLACVAFLPFVWANSLKQWRVGDESQPSDREAHVLSSGLYCPHSAPGTHYHTPASFARHACACMVHQLRREGPLAFAPHLHHHGVMLVKHQQMHK